MAESENGRVMSLRVEFEVECGCEELFEEVLLDPRVVTLDPLCRSVEVVQEYDCLNRMALVTVDTLLFSGVFPLFFTAHCQPCSGSFVSAWRSVAHEMSSGKPNSWVICPSGFVVRPHPTAAPGTRSVVVFCESLHADPAFLAAFRVLIGHKWTRIARDICRRAPKAGNNRGYDREREMRRMERALYSGIMYLGDGWVEVYSTQGVSVSLKKQAEHLLVAFRGSWTCSGLAGSDCARFLIDKISEWDLFSEEVHELYRALDGLTRIVNIRISKRMAIKRDRPCTQLWYCSPAHPTFNKVVYHSIDSLHPLAGQLGSLSSASPDMVEFLPSGNLFYTDKNGQTTVCWLAMIRQPISSLAEDYITLLPTVVERATHGTVEPDSLSGPCQYLSATLASVILGIENIVAKKCGSTASPCPLSKTFNVSSKGEIVWGLDTLTLSVPVNGSSTPLSCPLHTSASCSPPVACKRRVEEDSMPGSTKNRIGSVWWVDMLGDVLTLRIFSEAVRASTAEPIAVWRSLVNLQKVCRRFRTLAAHPALAQHAFNLTYGHRARLHRGVASFLAAAAGRTSAAAEAADWIVDLSSRVRLDMAWKQGRFVSRVYPHSHSASIRHIIAINESTTATVSGDPRKFVLFTGSSDRKVKSWTYVTPTGQDGDNSNLTPGNTYGGPTAGVAGLSYDPSGRVVTAGFKNGAVRSWSVERNELVLQHHVVLSAEGFLFLPSRVVTFDQSVSVYDHTTAKVLMNLVGHTKRVSCAKSLGTMLFTGSLDKTVRVWDASSGTCVLSIKGHSAGVNALELLGGREVARDGCCYLATGSNDKTIKVWDLRALEGGPVWTLRAHQGPVRCLKYSGGRLISGGDDQSVKVWSATTPEFDLMCQCSAYPAPVTVIDASDEVLFAGSSDGVLVAYDFFATSLLRTP